VRRVLVANRGEIAVRVIRACRALGLESVAVYSEADRGSLATQLADRALCIGPPRSSDSYLRIDTLVTAARGTGCDAVHPGYGFLAENPAFAEMCARSDLTFVGPPPEVIRLMGDKIAARQFAAKLGVPVISGTEEALHSVDEASAVATEVGYPVLLKAAAGGGGRGMRIVRAPDELREAFERARVEAQAAFADGRLYVERFVEEARHIEVQVLADEHGSCIHLGERDCSLQRRHQKLVEEAPSPVLPDSLRRELLESAVTLAREAGYRSAGTIEFLVEPARGRYYFLEMNTRIQVEHPVTEMVTGVDLVTEQFRVAAGSRLSVARDQVRVRGHAIETRVNAEAADDGFRPSPGRITSWRAPEGEGIRVDTHCFEGYDVPPFYDSLLAKTIAFGANREEARTRLLDALGRFTVGGIQTTISLHRRVLAHPDFIENRIHTRWIEESFLGSGGRAS
jgi:acetyl-CoA carboxylase, biotin carboxylase subunit